jgi:hypothetical protein
MGGGQFDICLKDGDLEGWVGCSRHLGHAELPLLDFQLESACPQG